MGLGAYRERCALVAVATLLMAATFVLGGYFLPVLVHKTINGPQPRDRRSI